MLTSDVQLHSALSLLELAQIESDKPANTGKSATKTKPNQKKKKQKTVVLYCDILSSYTVSSCRPNIN